MHTPFSSPQYFRQQFNQGLSRLLEKQQLGTFILCLANATNDAELFEQLKHALQAQYNLLLSKYREALNSGVQINTVEEDFLVFLKLHMLGFDNIQLTQLRSESHWQCQYNQLRSFRPARISGFQHNGEIFTAFSENQFNFNKPFMAKECFWSGDYNNKKLDLFYNKYPFCDMHGLIVPQREDCFPQFLIEGMHHYIWQLSSDLAETLPGVAMAYNSYGAYASINHLHFQMFISQQGLPVSNSCWKHNGGEYNYPLKVYASNNQAESWRIIDELHHRKQAYNLLYMPNEIFIMPRQVQGSIDVPTWSSGFTWYELSGAMLLFNKADYNALNDIEINRLLKQHSV